MNACLKSFIQRSNILELLSAEIDQNFHGRAVISHKQRLEQYLSEMFINVMIYEETWSTTCLKNITFKMNLFESMLPVTEHVVSIT